MPFMLLIAKLFCFYCNTVMQKSVLQLCDLSLPSCGQDMLFVNIMLLPADYALFRRPTVSIISMLYYRKSLDFFCLLIMMKMKWVHFSFDFSHKNVIYYYFILRYFRSKMLFYLCRSFVNNWITGCFLWHSTPCNKWWKVSELFHVAALVCKYKHVLLTWLLHEAIHLFSLGAP